jgi:hypothetical protein
MPRSIEQKDRLQSSPRRVEMKLLQDQSSHTGVSAVRKRDGVVTLDVQLQMKVRIVTSVSGGTRRPVRLWFSEQARRKR